jgi:D-apionolactonase
VRESSRFEIWYGRGEPPVETRELSAGPLTARLEGIDLRYVRIGGVEAVRRLFVAVRDASWGTIPPQVSDLEVEAQADSFSVAFEAFHEAGELRFRWRGELAGGADGTLDCRLNGVAESDFEYNRIGFCVLHPRENAGRPYRAGTPDGELTGTLPDLIGAQRFEDGKIWPLFPSYDRIDIELEDGLWARFEFEGDLFEMEDQRNWTDASFKTYSTPLALGWPHHAVAGQEIRQRVRLTFEGKANDAAEPGGPIRIELGDRTSGRLPPLGLGTASHGAALSGREAELLRALRLDHVRADVRPGEKDWQAELRRAIDDSRALGVPLEVALFLGDGPEEQLEAVAEAAEGADVVRFLVFKDGEVVTGPRWVRLARERLGEAFSAATFAGGTDQWFTELNRQRPDLDGLDAIAYSVTATVHADDDTSVMETPTAQGDTVRSARALSNGLPVLVGPVTIRPRFWPFGSFGAGDLPFQVDPRQCSLFGAAWTLASAKHLAEAGAGAVTYFETTGWRGTVETEAGPPRPDLFPSRAGTAFPLYHVLADLAEWKEGDIVEADSSAPLAVEALGIRGRDGLHVLLANLTAEPQRCSLGPLDVSEVALRVLDEATVEHALDDPEAFRATRERRPIASGRLELELGPYSVVRLDPA